MSQLVTCDIERTLADLEQSIGAERKAGTVLGREVVDALDVLHHALELTGHPEGLLLWRKALYDGTIVPEARAAIRQMLGVLNEAVERDEVGRILEICDCLEVFMRPQDHVGASGRPGLKGPHGPTDAS